VFFHSPRSVAAAYAARSRLSNVGSTLFSPVPWMACENSCRKMFSFGYGSRRNDSRFSSAPLTTGLRGVAPSPRARRSQNSFGFMPLCSGTSVVNSSFAMITARTFCLAIASRMSFRPSSIRRMIHAASASASSLTFFEPSTGSPSASTYFS
jgi:hypothetical protein